MKISVKSLDAHMDAVQRAKLANVSIGRIFIFSISLEDYDGLDHNVIVEVAATGYTQALENLRHHYNGLPLNTQFRGERNL